MVKTSCISSNNFKIIYYFVLLQAMVDKYSSISTRKLSKAFSVLSHDKTMVSMSDYGDFHKMTKRFVMASLLGPSAQKQFQDTRKHMMDNMVNIFRTSMIDAPHATQNFRKVYRAEIFRVNMIQVSVQIPRFSVLIRYCHDFVNLNRRGMSMLHF
jgi:hypothetical protein